MEKIIEEILKSEVSDTAPTSLQDKVMTGIIKWPEAFKKLTEMKIITANEGSELNSNRLNEWLKIVYPGNFKVSDVSASLSRVGFSLIKAGLIEKRKGVGLKYNYFPSQKLSEFNLPKLKMLIAKVGNKKTRPIKPAAGEEMGKPSLLPDHIPPQGQQVSLNSKVPPVEDIEICLDDGSARVTIRIGFQKK